MQLDDERPGVEEDLVAEVDGAARDGARVRSRIQHGQPSLQRVVHAAPGGQLHHQSGAGPQRGDGLGQPDRIEGGLVLLVADVHVHHGGASCLAGSRLRYQLGQRGGQLRPGRLLHLGPGGRHSDQGRMHQSIVHPRAAR